MAKYCIKRTLKTLIVFKSKMVFHFQQFLPPFILYVTILIMGEAETGNDNNKPEMDLSTWANLILITASAWLGPFLNRSLRTKHLKGCQLIFCSNPNEVVVVA